MKLSSLQEALKISEFRPKVKLQRDTYQKLPEKIKHLHWLIFGEQDQRIYFTLDGEREHFLGGEKKQKKEGVFSIDKIIRKVNEYLASKGYIVDNINQNRAYKFIDLSTEKGKMSWSKIPEESKKNYIVKGHIVKIPKNEFSITKLLNDNPDLKKEYEAYYQKVQSKSTGEEEQVNEDDMLIVISRHAYDIAGASTDREDKNGKGWDSCMNINHGVNKHYIKFDIKGGNIISYLVKKSDLNINKPIARVLIKKYKKPKTGEIVFYPEQSCYSGSYSQAVDKYVEVIQKILIDLQEEAFKKGSTYKFIGGKQQYRDSETKSSIYVNPEGKLGLVEKDKELIVSKIKELEANAFNAIKSIVENPEKRKGLINDAKEDMKERVIECIIDDEDIIDRKEMLKLYFVGLPKKESEKRKIINKFLEELFKRKDAVEFIYKSVFDKEKNMPAKYFYSETYIHDEDLGREVDDDDGDEYNLGVHKFMSSIKIKDLSHMNKSYKTEIEDFIEKFRYQGLGFGYDIIHNSKNDPEGRITIALTPKIYFRVNIIENLVNFLKMEFPDFQLKKIPNYEMFESEYMYGDVTPENRDATYRKINKLAEDAYERNLIDEEDWVYESLGKQALLPFVDKKIADGTYKIEQFFGKDKIPVEQLYSDFLKFKKINFNHITLSFLENFLDYYAAHVVDYHGLDEKYGEFLQEISTYNERNKTLKKVNKMIDAGVLTKEDFDLPYGPDDAESNKRKIFEFYSKFKAFGKKAKAKKTNEVKENYESIKDFINLYKALV